MDTYLEYMVKPKKNAAQVLICIAYYLIAATLSYVLFYARIPFIIFFYPAVVFFLFWGAYKLSGKYSVEYEYILTNDELDVDRIIAKKERKRLLTVSVRKFEIMAPAKGEEFNKEWNSSDVKVKFDASLGENSENRYFAKFINKKNEKMILVFNPTEEMQKAIKQSNMRNVYLEG